MRVGKPILNRSGMSRSTTLYNTGMPPGVEGVQNQDLKCSYSLEKFLHVMFLHISACVRTFWGSVLGGLQPFASRKTYTYSKRYATEHNPVQYWYASRRRKGPKPGSKMFLQSPNVLTFDVRTVFLHVFGRVSTF